MRESGRQTGKKEMHEANHLPILIFFIVCNFAVFKAKFMNASCVIVHQLMNGASQCVHKIAIHN